MRRSILLALAMATAILPASANAATTILSVDFENGFGAFTPSGQVAIADGADYHQCCGTQSDTSNHFAAFGGGQEPSGLILNAFNTFAGSLYTLTFDYGALGGGTDPLTVTVGGVSHVYSPVANNDLNSTFQQASFSFVGTGSPTTLSFQSAGTANVDAIVDNVVLSAVPEPATWAMLLFGFGAVGYSLRRRKSAGYVRAQAV